MAAGDGLLVEASWGAPIGYVHQDICVLNMGPVLMTAALYMLKAKHEIGGETGEAET
jgi:hypothetical protein